MPSELVKMCSNVLTTTVVTIIKCLLEGVPDDIESCYHHTHLDKSKL